MKTLSRKEVKKDIEENRNHSWIEEILERHDHELDRIIIDYFGKKYPITSSIKRDKKALVEEGTSKCIAPKKINLKNKDIKEIKL